MSGVEPAGAPGEAGDPASRRGLSRRARGAILIVVLGTLMVVGMVVGQRRRDDFDHAMTRVQLEADAAGDSIDIEAFRLAYAEELTKEWVGDETRPAQALVPAIDGAEAVNYTVTTTPARVVIDYQVSAGGQDGCVQVVRASDGTTTRTARDICIKAFAGGAPD